MIAKAMKERIIRQRWHVLPRAGLFRDRVITASLSFPPALASRAGARDRNCEISYSIAVPLDERGTISQRAGRVQEGVLPSFSAVFDVHLLTLCQFSSKLKY
jgi:hypothetical protein